MRWSNLQFVFVLLFLTLGVTGFLESAVIVYRVLGRAPWFPFVGVLLVVSSAYVVRLWWMTVQRSLGTNNQR